MLFGGKDVDLSTHYASITFEKMLSVKQARSLSLDEAVIDHTHSLYEFLFKSIHTSVMYSLDAGWEHIGEDRPMLWWFINNLRRKFTIP